MIAKSFYKLKVRKIQFSALDNKTELKLCSQVCVTAFRKKKGILEKETLKTTEVRKTITRSEKTFVRKCSECQANILDGDEKVLCWETMDFCHEDCLCKYLFRYFLRKNIILIFYFFSKIPKCNWFSLREL